MARDRWRTIGLIAGFWALEAVYSAAQVVYRTAGSEKPWPWSRALWSESVYAYMGALLTPGILWLVRRYPLERKTWARWICIQLAGASVFAGVMKINWDLVGGLSRAAYLYQGFTVDRLLRSVMMAYDLGFVLYWGIVLTLLAAEYYRRFQESRVQLERAQLQALRTQLDPHFLFNTLHGISELVHEDPEGAERMIAGLSELLRRSLDSSSEAEVPLREEIGFLTLYLDIEKTRFDDRLIVHLRIAKDTESAMVPSLILQPLVENAIRHGISHRLTGGRVEVAAERTEGGLMLSVWNNGNGLAPELIEGIGLSSVRGRLEKLYGERQRFELKSVEGGVEARVLIPYGAN